jgi:hypothetical protein
MGLTFAASQALFRAGHYLDLVTKSDLSPEAIERLSSEHVALLASALVHIDARRARELAQRENRPDAPLVVRTACELVLGNACRRDGLFKEAITHYRRTLQLAKEGGDADRAAWACLQLFRLLAEFQPHDGAVAVLRDARAWVTIRTPPLTCTIPSR